LVARWRPAEIFRRPR